MGMLVPSYRAAAVGAGAYTALDASGLSPIYSAWKLPMKRSPQIVPAYNSPNPFVRGTGNAAWTASFQSITEHATEAAALAYQLAQTTAIPETIDLEIVIGATTYYMPACVFALFDPDEQTGISNTIRYQFIGSLLTTTAP